MYFSCHEIYKVIFKVLLLQKMPQKAPRLYLGMDAISERVWWNVKLKTINKKEESAVYNAKA